MVKIADVILFKTTRFLSIYVFIFEPNVSEFPSGDSVVKIILRKAPP